MEDKKLNAEDKDLIRDYIRKITGPLVALAAILFDFLEYIARVYTVAKAVA